jgi:hypothetical protein
LASCATHTAKLNTGHSNAKAKSVTASAIKKARLPRGAKCKILNFKSGAFSMPTIYKDIEVEIDIDITDFNDDDLLDEIERRNLGVQFEDVDMKELIQTMYQRFRLNKSIDEQLRIFFYQTLGRIA